MGMWPTDLVCVITLMSSDIFEEVQREGQHARDWLRDNLSQVRKKWKKTQMEYFDKSLQTFQDESGRPRRYICSPYYLITYHRSWFRLFGIPESASIKFSEDDLCSLSYRRETAHALWDAAYSLHLELVHGRIEINYNPPFFGVTPISSARPSEHVRVSYGLRLQPETGA